ncbi:MAG: spermidine synthase [Kiritimatiellae bacterium]|jgi:spermidine synthase|nr:spermidine synthase [Kiritimatiellia bacterium]
MRLNFEELDYKKTPLGELVLQRRNAVEVDGREIYEVKLNDEYLMSTLFYDGEIALTNLGLNELAGEQWDVAVGGLGLGFTAAEVLKSDKVGRMVVVEALKPVIEWHQRKLVPNGAVLTDDPRCIYHNADFFALARGNGFDQDKPNHQFDAILLDIDHTPDALLNPSHADLYSETGLTNLYRFLKPGGVFALWSNEAPEKEFMGLLSYVFDKTEGHIVEFANPIQGNTAINGIYIGHKSPNAPSLN